MVHVEKFGMEQGLSNRQVNTICKDSRGLLWIGTEYGLNSYDGYNFKTYTRQNSNLPFNVISKMLPGPHNTLFLLDPKKTIAVFNTLTGKSFLLADSFPGLNPQNFPNTVTDRHGTLYASNWVNDTILIYKGTGFTLKSMQGLKPLSFLHAGPRNTLYAIYNDSTLLELDTTLTIINRHAFGFKLKIYAFGLNQTGFIVREHGNYANPRLFFVSEQWKITPLAEKDLPPRDTSEVDFAFYTETDGIIWRQGKLYTTDNKLIVDLATRTSRDISGLLRTICIGNDKEIWAGNNFGLYKIAINRNKFRSYFSSPVFEENNKTSYRGIYTTGDTVLGSNEANGLFICNSTTGNTLKTSLAEGFGGYTFIVPDGKGNLLQGYFEGLNILHLRTGKTRRIAFHNDQRRLWALCQINNNLFLGGSETGLMLYDNSAETLSNYNGYGSFKELQNAFVLSVSKDAHGLLWLCTDKGLYTMDTALALQARYHTGGKGIYKLPFDNIYTLHLDTGNVAWLGGPDGLVQWNRRTGSYHIYNRQQGLSDNTIYSIYADAYNHLWLSSNYGLMRFDKATGNVKTYLTKDGIAHNEFNRIAGFKDAGGKLYFGSLNGITSFNPDDFARDNDVRKVPFIITSFTTLDHDSGKFVDNTPALLTGSEMVIKPDDRLFSIAYSLLNYANTGKILYAYKIDNNDGEEWAYTNEHTLSFGRIPYGKHVLRLKAKAPDTDWSNEVTVPLRVLKPFYLQAWFFMLVLILCALAVSAYIARRTYRYKQEQKRLETEVTRKTATITQQSEALQVSLREKETLLKEIHHRVKNNMQVISGLLSLQGRDSGNDEIKAIMQEGRDRIHSMALIHQMLYQNEDLQRLNFGEYLKGLAHQLQASGINPGQPVDIHIQAPDVLLDLDTAIPMGLIVNELVTNTLKHAFDSSGGAIEISVEGSGENSYRMLFKDTGKGLPANFNFDTSRTLGLRLVKMLCGQIRATINFKSDSGTQVLIVFTDNWKS